MSDPILVTRMVRCDRSVVGVRPATSAAYRFPDVGEQYEWPGPELVPIRSGRPFPGELVETDGTVRQLASEGLHGFPWCIGGEELGQAIAWWRLHAYSVWMVIECDPQYVVFDGCGGCRAKRGRILFVGDATGMVELLKSRWPSETSSVPAWETNVDLFPPQPVVEPPRRPPWSWPVRLERPAGY